MKKKHKTERKAKDLGGVLDSVKPIEDGNPQLRGIIIPSYKPDSGEPDLDTVKAAVCAKATGGDGKPYISSADADVFAGVKDGKVHIALRQGAAKHQYGKALKELKVDGYSLQVRQCAPGKGESLPPAESPLSEAFRNWAETSPSGPRPAPISRGGSLRGS